MKLSPTRAASIYFATFLAAAILVTALLGRRALLPVGSVLVAGLISATLFWAGARVAGRPHSIRSLISAILITWSFTYATNGLGNGFYADIGIMVIQFAFVFMVAWRFAPKIRSSAASAGDDAPV